MQFRERFHEPERSRQTPPPGEPSQSLESTRAAGEEFFDAADQAIARALSADSQLFNHAVEQEGGE